MNSWSDEPGPARKRGKGKGRSSRGHARRDGGGARDKRDRRRDKQRRNANNQSPSSRQVNQVIAAPVSSSDDSADFHTADDTVHPMRAQTESPRRQRRRRVRVRSRRSQWASADRSRRSSRRPSRSDRKRSKRSKRSKRRDRDRHRDTREPEQVTAKEEAPALSAEGSEGLEGDDRAPLSGGKLPERPWPAEGLLPHRSPMEFDPTAGLAADQLVALDTLRDRFEASGVAVQAPDEPYNPRRNKIFCDDMCLLRYLRARSYDVDKAEAMLRDTLAWREVYLPHMMRWRLSPEEPHNPGKTYLSLHHLTTDQNLIFYLKPGADNTTERISKVKFFAYQLEIATLCVDERMMGAEKMVWVIDFTGNRLQGMDGIRIARDAVSVFQNHYPERLKRAYFYNTPWYFNGFFKMITPLVDEVTLAKVRFVKDGDYDEILGEISPEVLEAAYGGNSQHQYDPEHYIGNLLDPWDAWLDQVFGVPEDLGIDHYSAPTSIAQQ